MLLSFLFANKLFTAAEDANATFSGFVIYVEATAYPLCYLYDCTFKNIMSLEEYQLRIQVNKKTVLPNYLKRLK